MQASSGQAGTGSRLISAPDPRAGIARALRSSFQPGLLPEDLDRLLKRLR